MSGDPDPPPTATRDRTELSAHQEVDIPRGDLVRSRVVPDPGDALETVLDRELTGYAVVEPADALLLDDAAPGVITFEGGVPVLAYHVGSDRGGPAALADLTAPGPSRVELYDLDPADLERAHTVDDLRVPPGMPAERLAGDDDLADRTRDLAPERPEDDDSEASEDDVSAVEAFLADEEKIESIQDRARTEARESAEEWGLTDQLADE